MEDYVMRQATQQLVLIMLIGFNVPSWAQDSTPSPDPTAEPTAAPAPVAEPTAEVKPAEPKPTDSVKRQEVVVVTASKLEESLTDAPATMSVLGGDSLAVSPAQNYGDILR